jgi:general stress protein 26
MPSGRLMTGLAGFDRAAMTAQENVVQNPRGAVFDTLERVRAGMLGLAGSGDGFQPMTHFADPEPGLIWFISSTATALVQSLGMGEDAEYVVISEHHDVHVSMRGMLYHLYDAAKLDALWNPKVAAWFEGGRGDPRVALLRFEPEVANIWASSEASLKIGFEMARASLDPSRQPEIGVKATVRFAKAA